MMELISDIWATTKGKMIIIFLALIVLVGLMADVIASDQSSIALIPFGPETVSSTARSYQPPGYAELLDNGQRKLHLLGTDEIGRDVMSRLIHGINTALIVGLGSTLISMIIAFLLGSLAGYYGDSRLRANPWVVLFATATSLLMIYYARQAAYIYDDNEVLRFSTSRFVMLCGIGLVVIGMVSYYIHHRVSTNWSLPVDGMVLRLLEIFKSIPTLFLLLSIYAIITTPSLWLVVILIGLLRWTSATRLIRAEVMRAREDNYIKNAELTGLSTMRLITGHLLPNIAGPIIIAICFSIGTAILVESTLSFLQIGLPMTEVSWGQMLSRSRNYFNAWWLAVPPGLMIFALILSFNSLGELTEAILARKKR